MSKEVKEVGKNQETIVRFDNVSFEWGVNKLILDEVSFTVRRGMKFTLMGQMFTRPRFSPLLTRGRLPRSVFLCRPQRRETTISLCS